MSASWHSSPGNVALSHQGRDVGWGDQTRVLRPLHGGTVREGTETQSPASHTMDFNTCGSQGFPVSAPLHLPEWDYPNWEVVNKGKPIKGRGNA